MYPFSKILYDSPPPPGPAPAKLCCHPLPIQLADWLDAQIAPLKKLPRYLIPCYFSPVLYAAYTACTQRAMAQMETSVGKGDAFVQVLLLFSRVLIFWLQRTRAVHGTCFRPQCCLMAVERIR